MKLAKKYLNMKLDRKCLNKICKNMDGDCMYPDADGSKLDFEDLDKSAFQKDQNYDKETTWWIFEDGSAIGLNSAANVCIDNNYGTHTDNEQLK